MQKENPVEMILICPCGQKLSLEIVGGQYQNEYKIKCSCGRIWILSDVSSQLEELEDGK